MSDRKRVTFLAITLMAVIAIALTLTDRSQALKGRPLTIRSAETRNCYLSKVKKSFASIPLATRYSGATRSNFTGQLKAPGLVAGGGGCESEDRACCRFES